MKLKYILEYSNGTLIGDFDLNMDINDFSIDSRKIGEETFFIPLVGENNDGHDYIQNAFENGAIGTFSAKDITNISGKIIIKVDDTKKAMQRLATNFRINNKQIPLVAITGSVGKTTTKDMVYSVLASKFNALKTEGNFNNDIGLPLTLCNYENEDVIVLEMGMNHFNEISFLSNIAKPDVAIITNIGHSHIGNLGSRENILKAKLEILDGMDESGTLIINADDDMLSNVKDIKQKIVTFGIQNEADVRAYNINIEKDFTTFYVMECGNEYKVKLNMVGEKLIYNALVAWTIGKLYNISANNRVRALEKCEFTKMRLNIKKLDNITIIDDCYNANPESMKLALEALTKQEGNRKIAILGDMLELGDYSENLHQELGRSAQGVDELILTGNFSNEIRLGAINSGMDAKKIFVFDNVDELVANISNYVSNGDVTLVKASRAMKFEKIVEKLEGGSI